MSARDLGFVRFVIFGLVLLFIFLSQRFWFLRVWRFTVRIHAAAIRYSLRVLWLTASLVVLVFFLLNISWRGPSINLQHPSLIALSGLWITSALFAYLAVKLVHAVAALWQLARRAAQFLFAGPQPAASPEPDASSQSIDLPRRRFLHTSSVVAAAIPFTGAGYGFLIERFNFQIRQVSLPIANLPLPLAGMRIAQLSDVHIGSFMSASGVRRAVEMTNELNADLTVVTGDFITRRGDPLEACIIELARLRAPLGVWGCNGNHEIYANAEAEAARLFSRYGMCLLRQQSVEVVHRAQAINLIGVDYQRQPDARRVLTAAAPLVRRDIPNILLSHNPNSFPRAAELGIELMLTGHTHGGQVKVEILDYRFSPAEFLTPYVAGMYVRPLRSFWDQRDKAAWQAAPMSPASVVYVNRGLGTIGAPVRLGVPPEISLLTLRRA